MPKNQQQTTQEWPRWAESIAEADRITGISRMTLTGWRKADCPAFRSNGRINLHDLKKWIEAEGKKAGPEPEALTELRRQIAAEDLRKKKTFNDEQDGLLVRKEDVTKEAAPTLKTIVAMTYQKLENEAPTSMAGVDVPTGRIIGRRLADELIKFWQELFRKWGV
jgi:hypothetical protein